MKLSEAGELLALISAYDNRNFNKETTAAWYDLLGPFTLAEAKQAVKKHYAENPDWLMPSHVRSAIKADRKARLAKLGPINPNRADMTDVATELTTARELTQAIASGALTPEQYDDYLRGDTPWTEYRRGILALRGAA
ncbi:hypothetical protein AAFP32_12140 [Brevibacterium sp. CBA3109]|uniref:Uncharacterized protein n=1 Tax=Brevibacterium koreense TaxID=3140787 RepID=A0AAU7UIV1_9MICO